jgi:hypothetical protein
MIEKVEIEDIDSPNVLGEMWKEISFLDSILRETFIAYSQEEWKNEEVPYVLLDFFSFLEGDEIPEVAWNHRHALWVAWYNNYIIFYHDATDISVYNTDINNPTSWEFF